MSYYFQVLSRPYSPNLCNVPIIETLDFVLIFLLSESKYLSYFAAFILYLTLAYRIYLKECPFNYNINKNKDTTLFIEKFINLFFPQKIKFLNKIDIVLIIGGLLFIIKGKLLKN